jgi:D-ribose pyranose/furanose isomerase RbsD
MKILKIFRYDAVLVAAKLTVFSPRPPKAINGQEKTDWNDVHKIEGLDRVKQQLGLIRDEIHVRDVSIQLTREAHNEKKELTRAFNQMSRDNQQNRAISLDEITSSSIKQKTLDLEI